MTERVVRGDAWFDGERVVREPVSLTLRDGVIARIVRETGAAERTGKLVMPGLVNAHVHIARGGVFEASERISPAQAGKNLRGTLASGTTTVGDMGCAAELLASLRAHVARDPLAGPQIRGSGPLLTAPRGYPLDWMPPLFARMGLALAIDDDRSARAAVQRVARAGMDHVKLAVMHRSYSDAPLSAVSEPAARAVVLEAHQSGLRVFAHAHSVADYRVALAAGVDALMHSSFEPLDEATVARVRDAGVTVCPTLWVFESVCLGAEMRLDQDDRYTRHVLPYIRRSWGRFADAYEASTDVVPPGIAGGITKTRIREAVRIAAANLALLRDAGVPIAFGNDASYGFSLVARPTDELAAMQRAGMDATACLKAATSTAADLLGLTDRGTLAEGKRADLLLVDLRALDDVAALESPFEVYAAGTPLSTTRSEPSLSTTLAFAAGLARTAAHALRNPS